MQIPFFPFILCYSSAKLKEFEIVLIKMPNVPEIQARFQNKIPLRAILMAAVYFPVAGDIEILEEM